VSVGLAQSSKWFYGEVYGSKTMEDDQNSRPVAIQPGLPESWLDEEGVRRNLRNLSNKSGGTW
jgi:hypothetical protein